MAHLSVDSFGSRSQSILVIGVGNRFRRDDGFGWHVVAAVWRLRGVQRMLDELEELQSDAHGSLCTLCVPQIVPELVELVSRQRLVIVVDAAVCGPEGLNLTEVRPEVGCVLWRSHSTGVGHLAALSKQLYGIAPRILLLSAKGKDFAFGEGLSEALSQSVELAAHKILSVAGLNSGGIRCA